MLKTFKDQIDSSERFFVVFASTNNSKRELIMMNERIHSSRFTPEMNEQQADN
jgi:hypothetical protein